MFCPKCGASAQVENAYCTRCGEMLPGSHNWQIKNSFLLMPYLNGLCALLATISFIALLVAFPNDSGGWAVAIAGVSCFLIAIYQFLTLIMSFRLSRRFVKGRVESSDHKEELKATAGDKFLNAGDSTQFIKAQSVTENTTELLGSVAGKQGKNS